MREIEGEPGLGRLHSAGTLEIFWSMVFKNVAWVIHDESS